MDRPCVKCKHYIAGSMASVAECAVLEGKPDPVSGGDFPKNVRAEVQFMRAVLCGWKDPKFWEPKP